MSTNIHTPNDVHTFIQDSKPLSLPLPISCIWQMLTERAEKEPQKTAILMVDTNSQEETAVTYQNLQTLVIRCANHLYHEYGVRNGDHFAFCYDNRIEVLILSLAGAIMGATAVPLDARRDVVERMAYKLDLTKAKVLLTHPRGSYKPAWFQKIQRLQTEVKATPIICLRAKDNLLTRIAPFATTPDFPIVEDATHIHITLFTSGTTADPKGAQLSCANLLYNANGIRQWLQIGPDDRFGILLPLHHINSTAFSLATLLAGGTLILFSEPPRQQFWQLMARYEVTATSIVQKILYNLLELPEAFAAMRTQLKLQRIQIGSDVVDPQAARQFVDNYGIPLHQGYGLTEVAFRATGVPMGLPPEDYQMLIRKNSIGAALDGVNVCVVNEAGQEVAAGEKGEFCIRGPIVMQGYLQNPTATTAAFEGGWFHSGDIGWYEVILGRKFFFYHSRQKEIIKKGGSLLSPAAIDRSIRAHFPQLEDAFAFGYPDKGWGEDIWMVVRFKEEVPPAKRQEITAAIVSQGQQEALPGLPKFEAPSHVIDWDITFPNAAIPRTSTMKVQRARLKQMVAAHITTSP